MGFITYNNLADGTTIEASDLNSPINTIVNTVNGNIDANNIAAGSLTPGLMASGNNLVAWRAAATVNFCADGCVWSHSAGLIGAMSGGNIYIDGALIVVSPIISKTFTASKDTYVDVDASGQLIYTEVANGAAAPALEASRFRLAKVITSGVAITNHTAATAVPSFQQGIDSLGNTIFNCDPFGIIKWYFPTLLNSWVEYDVSIFQKTCYGKNKAGTVNITGLVKSGTPGAGSVVFTLPVGYRPTVCNIFAVNTYSNAMGRADINAAGSVIATVGSGTYFSLCLSFQATGGN